LTDEVGNLVLEQLRLVRVKMETISDDVADIKIRMSATERHLGEIQMQAAALNGRMDRFDERLGRIERRLGLVDA
jgi:hypothetical protein